MKRKSSTETAAAAGGGSGGGGSSSIDSVEPVSLRRTSPRRKPATVTAATATTLASASSLERGNDDHAKKDVKSFSLNFFNGDDEFASARKRPPKISKEIVKKNNDSVANYGSTGRDDCAAKGSTRPKQGGTTAAAAARDGGGGGRSSSSKKPITTTTTTTTTAAAADIVNAGNTKISCSIRDVDETFGFWTDELCPHGWGELLLHPEVNAEMQALVATTEARHQLTHLIVYGRKGSGCKTRVNCLLQSIFRSKNAETGEIIEAVNRFTETRHFQIPATSKTSQGMMSVSDGGASSVSGGGGGNTSTTTTGSSKYDLAVLLSPFHVELTPSDLAHRDFAVVQHCIKMLGEPTSLRNYIELVDTSDEFLTKEQRIAASSATTRVPEFGTASAAIATAAAPKSGGGSSRSQQQQGRLDRQRASSAASSTTSTTTAAAAIPSALPVPPLSVTHRMCEDNPMYKVVVINHADMLHDAAQARLRRIMEQNCKFVRFILVAEDVSKLIDPIVSRCKTIRVPSPSDEDVVRVLRHALKKSGRDQIGVSSGGSSSRIDENALLAWLRVFSKSCNGNLNMALIGLQFLVQREHRGVSLSELMKQIPAPCIRVDWMTAIDQLAGLIVQRDAATATLGHILHVRRIVNELLSHSIPAHLITQTLANLLWERTHDTELLQIVAHYDRLLLDGRMPDIHLTSMCFYLLENYNLSQHGYRLVTGKSPNTSGGGFHNQFLLRTMLKERTLRRTHRFECVAPRSQLLCVGGSSNNVIDNDPEKLRQQKEHAHRKEQRRKWREFYKERGCEDLLTLRIREEEEEEDARRSSSDDEESCDDKKN